MVMKLAYDQRIMTSFIFQLFKQQPRRLGSHKNTNTISIKHISSPMSDKCLWQITLKSRHFQILVTVTVTTQSHHTVFHFCQFHDYTTVLYLSSWQLLFYTVLGCYFIDQDSAQYQIPLLSFQCSHSQDISSPSKMYSHGTETPKSPPLLTCFRFMTTFPQWYASSKTWLAK